jgi:hypothetical protein
MSRQMHVQSMQRVKMAKRISKAFFNLWGEIGLNTMLDALNTTNARRRVDLGQARNRA